MMNDPISDLLTRIRNAQTAKHPQVSVSYSKLKEQIVAILKREGFVGNCQVVGEGTKKQMVIDLRYHANGKGIIEALSRVSKPGRRIFSTYEELNPVRSGFGFAVLSTSKGLLTDVEARQQKVGGEILLEVW